MHRVRAVKFPNRMSVPCVPLSPLVCAPLSSVCCSGCVCGRILSHSSAAAARTSRVLWLAVSELTERPSCMHQPSLLPSLFLTGCTQCMTTIICITSDMELISLSFFDHIHIITSISFSSLHTAGCSRCCFVSLSFLKHVLLPSTPGCIDKQYFSWVFLTH